RTSASTLFPCTTLFRSCMGEVSSAQKLLSNIQLEDDPDYHLLSARISALEFDLDSSQRHMDMAIRIYENQDDFNKVRETTLMKVDRKSTRLNSSHVKIS